MQDVVFGFCPAGFGVCIVRVDASSRGSFGENWAHSTQHYKICIARSGLDYSTSASLWKQMPLVGARGSKW
jgi:hypothetical protein